MFFRGAWQNKIRGIRENNCLFCSKQSFNQKETSCVLTYEIQLLLIHNDSLYLLRGLVLLVFHESCQSPFSGKSRSSIKSIDRQNKSQVWSQVSGNVFSELEDKSKASLKSVVTSPGQDFSYFGDDFTFYKTLDLINFAFKSQVNASLK